MQQVVRDMSVHTYFGPLAPLLSAVQCAVVNKEEATHECALHR